MRGPHLKASVVVCALAGGSAMASAHVGFKPRQVALAAHINVILSVPHGCDGSPTARLRMRLPKAVTGVRAQPKHGWTIALSGEGAAREVSWSGALPGSQTGEFALSLEIDASVKPGDVLYFPVVQECVDRKSVV